MFDLINEIQSRRDWIDVQLADDSDEATRDASKGEEREVRLLDYACGTGTISRVCLSSCCFFVMM